MDGLTKEQVMDLIVQAEEIKQMHRMAERAEMRFVHAVSEYSGSSYQNIDEAMNELYKVFAELTLPKDEA